MKEQLLQQIQQLSTQSVSEIITFRRYLHSHPELSYQEFGTAQYIAARLRSFGISPQEGIAGTGVVASIEGKKNNQKNIALRADIDALPITELNSTDYVSQNPGVMHACGHDAHTASLLGTAKILQIVRDQFEGSIKLIFQPGEEKNPGGASMMIKEGVLQNPAPTAIIGQHVFSLLPVGKIGFREGKYMASSDEIYLKVIGKGGHGATPELTIDPVVITAHIITALQQVISRNASPKQPTVLTFGKIEAKGATNIIPDEVNIAGTFRALDETWRRDGLDRIQKIAKGMAESMGGACEVEIRAGYPCLENNRELTQRIKKAAIQYVGAENVVDIDLTLGSEDFAYYSQCVPASFYRLGTRNEKKGIISYVHTPTFDIDEEALAIAPGLMAWMAICELQ